MEDIIRKNEVEQLESQLRIMSHAAAEAIERATKLETELANSRNSISSASSADSISFTSPQSATTLEDRLRMLESAVRVIHKSRRELSSSYNYEFL